MYNTRSKPKRNFGQKSFGQPRRNFRRPLRKKVVKKFDPSQFVKKVETLTAEPAYTPVNTFQSFDLLAQIKKNIAFKGYVNPTPIQDHTIPLILEGNDVIGCANTGTGKTASFLLPLIHKLATKELKKCLIIAPTRELACQINDELYSFKFKTSVNAALCIGGARIGAQISQLRKKPDFVIGTPGRLRDLENSGHINFKDFDSIVLDEVDTMFDMGFIHDITHIVTSLPEQRQTIFFSATISPKIKDLINKHLNNPKFVNVCKRPSAENVNQEVMNVSVENKNDILHDLLVKPEFKKVIVFSRTKRATDKLSKDLRDRGFKVAAIHGDRTQQQRKKALDLFKINKISILLATDVVARGIDINDVSHVINYDLPQTHEDYIHRIGRTGRANKIGQAITFIEQVERV